MLNLIKKSNPKRLKINLNIRILYNIPNIWCSSEMYIMETLFICLLESQPTKDDIFTEQEDK